MLSCKLLEVITNSSVLWIHTSDYISGIAAAGMLRLLVSNQVYKDCHGGTTLLNSNINIDWWQVI